MLLILFYSAVTGSSDHAIYKVNGREFQLSGTGPLGIVLLALPIGALIVVFVLHAKKTAFAPHMLFKPSTEWGPKHDSDRARYAFERDDGVVYPARFAGQELQPMRSNV